ATVGISSASAAINANTTRILEMMPEYLHRRLFPALADHSNRIRAAASAIDSADLNAGFDAIQLGPLECQIIAFELGAKVEVMDENKAIYAVMDGTGPSGRPRHKIGILYHPDQALPFEIEFRKTRFQSLGAAILSIATPTEAERSLNVVADKIQTTESRNFVYQMLVQFMNSFVEYPDFSATFGTSSQYLSDPLRQVLAPFESWIRQYVILPANSAGTRPKYCDGFQFRFDFPTRSETGIYPVPLMTMGPVSKLVRSHGGKITALGVILTWGIAGPAVALPIVGFMAARKIVSEIEAALGIHPDRAILSKILTYTMPLFAPSPQAALILTGALASVPLALSLIPDQAISADLQHLFGYFCQFGIPILSSFGQPRLLQIIGKWDKALTEKVLLPFARAIDHKMLNPITGQWKGGKGNWAYKALRTRRLVK
ncbi:hypothetical protein EBR96_09935, partial [bacterium]|nr:hypothetical protein [bacterium]